MNPVYEKLTKCLESVRAKTDFVPKVAIVLGSGLGDYANDIEVACEIDYHDIEGFPVSTVPGHSGKFIFGYVGEVPVVCMKGRVPKAHGHCQDFLHDRTQRIHRLWNSRTGGHTDLRTEF